MRKNSAPLLALSVFTFALMQMAIPLHAFAEDAAPAKKEESASGGEDGKKPKKGLEDVTGGRFAGDPIYVHINPLILPVIDNSGVQQLVTIILDVQVKDFDAADDMHTNMPRVMDSLMRSLYGGLGQGTLRNGKIANIGKIKNKAVAAVGEVVGTDKVLDVLVQGVSQRML